MWCWVVTKLTFVEALRRRETGFPQKANIWNGAVKSQFCDTLVSIPSISAFWWDERIRIPREQQCHSPSADESAESWKDKIREKTILKFPSQTTVSRVDRSVIREDFYALWFSKKSLTTDHVCFTPLSLTTNRNIILLKISLNFSSSANHLNLLPVRSQSGHHSGIALRSLI